MKGIQQTTEAVEAIVKVAQSVKESLADGKFTLSDLLKFGDDIPVIFKAADGAGEILPELEGLTFEEIEEIQKQLESSITDFVGDENHEVVEKSLDLIVAIHALVRVV